MPEKYCLICGNSCNRKRAHALYCSSACKQIAYQRRKENLFTVQQTLTQGINEISESVTETSKETVSVSENVTQSVNEIPETVSEDVTEEAEIISETVNETIIESVTHLSDENVNDISSDIARTVTNKTAEPGIETKTETANKNFNTMLPEENNQETKKKNIYAYKRFPAHVKELNSNLCLWIHEFLELDECGFNIDGITELMKKIKGALDDYPDDLNNYPNMDFINDELLQPLHTLLDMLLDDPDEEGRLTCSEEHIAALKRKKHELF